MNQHRKRGAHAPRADADASVDPDLYFSPHQEHAGHARKTEQLRAAIERALGSALDCDLEDPLLADLHVVDVLVEPGGSFAALFGTEHAELTDIERRLRDAAPVLRLALGRSLMRKRVPQVSFHVVPMTGEVNDDE